jgi:plastocyanin
MKRLLVVLPAVAVIAVAAIPLADTGAAQTKMPGMSMPAARASSASKTRETFELHRSVVHLKILNFAFMPNHLVVSPGTHVVWTNEDSDPHTVTADHGAFSSQALDTGGKYTLVVRHTGTFTYHCTIHPFMHGTLVVQG